MKAKTKMKNELVKVLKKEYQIVPELDKVDGFVIIDISKNSTGVYAAINDSKIEVLYTPDLIEDFKLITTYPLTTDARLIANIMCELVRR